MANQGIKTRVKKLEQLIPAREARPKTDEEQREERAAGLAALFETLERRDKGLLPVQIEDNRSRFTQTTAAELATARAIGLKLLFMHLQKQEEEETDGH